MKMNTERKNLRMKCPGCGCWNSFPVNKIFLDQPSSEPKVNVLAPMYQPLEVVDCEKCGKVIAEPEELMRITQAKQRVQGRKP